MTDEDESAPETGKSPRKRLRNIVLAIILAGGALAMYFSIFVRLSTNPLQ